MKVLGVDWSDALTAIIALISAPLGIFALFQTRAALREQAIASDLQTVLVIWDKIDLHWDRFRKAASDKDVSFEFGQLTANYELACTLFRDDILSTKATRTLEEHLDEILPRMLSHSEFKSRFTELTSSTTTFENIRWFCGARRDGQGIHRSRRSPRRFLADVWGAVRGFQRPT